MEALDLVGLSDKRDVLVAQVTSPRGVSWRWQCLASMRLLPFSMRPMAGLNTVEIQNLLGVIKTSQRREEDVYSLDRNIRSMRSSISVNVSRSWIMA